MKILRLYGRNYNARKAVLHWFPAFLAFGPLSILLHFFTWEYDLFQGVFVASSVVLVEYIAFYAGRRATRRRADSSHYQE